MLILRDSDGNDCDLPTLCLREPGWAANRIGVLITEVETQQRAKQAWEQLYNERNGLWRDAAHKIDLIITLLEQNGCDCDCGHDSEGHDETCERCLGCRIAQVVEKDS